MAQISSISNGEAMSSVRTKLNNVITEINLLDPTDWVDYSATSTIVGWSSFTTKIIKYKIIGKQVFVSVNISGVSNATTATFTLPFNNLTYTSNYLVVADNGTNFVGFIQMQSGTNVISSLRWSGSPLVLNVYTASGTKSLIGQMFYEIA